MNWVEIETFLTIVNTHNLSKAAEALYLSQSAVSHRLHSLEADLGFELFERKRGSRQVELTKKGKQFIPAARQMQAAWQETRRIKEEMTDTLLNVSVNLSLNRYTLQPYYDYLMSSRIPFQIRTHRMSTSQMVDALKTGWLDAGFSFFLDMIQDEDIITEKLFCQNMIVTVPINSPLVGKTITPGDLDPADEITGMWGAAFNRWHDNYWKTDNKSSHPFWQVDDFSVHYLKKNPKSWVILPDKVLEEIQEMVPVGTCQLTPSPPQRTCYLMTSRYPVSEHKVMINHLRNGLQRHIKELGWQ